MPYGARTPANADNVRCVTLRYVTFHLTTTERQHFQYNHLVRSALRLDYILSFYFTIQPAGGYVIAQSVLI